MTLNEPRRVVTGVTPEGKSVVVSEGSPPYTMELDYLPGYKLWAVWTTDDDVPELPTDGHDDTPSMTSFSPGPNGTRFLIMRWPAGTESVGRDAAHNAAEFAKKMPGIAETVETDDPMMHTTDSIDYGVILSGEIWVELDDGAEAHLAAGDCFVQNGTRHAWRFRGSEPCVMAVVMVGARRQVP